MSPGLLFVLVTIIAAAGCTKSRAKTWQYRCPDGYVFTIRYSDPQNTGEVAFLEDQWGATRLPRARSASGAKYSSDATTFWSKGDAATIMVAGKMTHQNCRLID
jgi:membrane-bound inhibitor of C-type lysozyme